MEEIPALNLFMMCEKLNPEALSQIPAGFSIRRCRKDELEVWKSLHGDSPQQYQECHALLTDYFQRVYAREGDLFFKRCLFACDAADQPVGTCFVWRSYGKFNAVHWFKVAKSHEGQGIGRALLSCALKDLCENDYPVFLHTHPSSYRAIKLYNDFGFQLLDAPMVGNRKNDLEECRPILKKYMNPEAFSRLAVVKAPKFFLDAADSSDKEEF